MRITKKKKTPACCRNLARSLTAVLLVLACAWVYLFWSLLLAPSLTGDAITIEDTAAVAAIAPGATPTKEKTVVKDDIREANSLISDTVVVSEATPVYATPIQWKDDETQLMVDALYALPNNTNNQDPKGIVLLLHACTHTMYKFFSPSSACPQCIGLSEELRIVRLVLQKGYAVVAISSSSSSGCWNDSDDLARLQLVLSSFQQNVFRNSQKDVKKIAIGASSGGTMAAKLLLSPTSHQEQPLVDAALVMVMGLRMPTVQRLQFQHQQNPPSGLLFLAPMPKDQSTTRLAINNYQILSNASNNMVRLDTTTCDALPLTESYLLERVPGMTMLFAQTIILALQQRNHLDEHNKKFRLDPTKSDWREILKKIPTPTPQDNKRRNNKNLRDTQEQPNILASSPSLLWGQFSLEPGKSPLAKAFHRAWAFHEYCSEVVVPALEFFEQGLEI